MKKPSSYQIPMLLQPMGNQDTQIRFKMQKDGEPVWDQVTRLRNEKCEVEELVPEVNLS